LEVFGFAGRLDDILAHKPPAEIWQDVRNKGKKEEQIKDMLTLENDGVIWAPEVAETSRVLISLKTCKALPIGEDIELDYMTEVFSRLHRKSTWILLRRHR
jgi:hypothetical protein